MLEMDQHANVRAVGQEPQRQSKQYRAIARINIDVKSEMNLPKYLHSR